MRLILLNIIILLISNGLFAQSHLTRQLDHANNLFENGLAYDAITEYKRLLFFDESKLYEYDINHKIGLCYKSGNKYDDAIKYFALAEKSSRTENEKYNSKLEIIRCNILRGTTERALNLIDEIYVAAQSVIKEKDLNYWRGWAHMFADNWESASASFGAIDSAHQLKILADSVLNDKYSVTFAKVISYILPGSGQFYTGEYLSGFMSLGWNLLWGYVTIDSFVDDRIFDGFATGTLLWMKFYRGNIQNAEKFAINRNLEISNKAFYYLQNNYEGIKP